MDWIYSSISIVESKTEEVKEGEKIDEGAEIEEGEAGEGEEEEKKISLAYKYTMIYL